MNQAELISKVAATSGLTKTQVGDALAALILEVRNTLNAGGNVTLQGLVSISVKTRAGRAGRNPSTGQPMQIPAKKVPVIKALKPLKDAVAG